MSSFKTVHSLVILSLTSISLVACSGNRPSNLGISTTGLAPCPASPNCVSSTAHDLEHQIAALQFSVPADQAWRVVRKLVAELPRTRIVSEQSNYLHAECRSGLFGFVDDLELHLRPAEGIIALRSAARLGYSDFGVNRQRIEDLRTTLSKRKIIP